MWLRTWLLTALLLFAMVAALEALWRSEGHFATVLDDEALWAEVRSRVDDDPDTVVLVGMSRMQGNFSSEVFHERFPNRKLVHLAATTRHPVSALRSLANEPDFRGTIIASVAMPWLRRGVYPGFNVELAYLEKQYNWNARINRNVATLLQSRLVVLNPALGLRDVIQRRITTGTWPSPYFMQTHPDRSREEHFDMVPNVQTVTNNLALVTAAAHQNKHLTPAQLLAQLKEVDLLATRIRARGGRMIFVRFPTTGKMWQLDEKHYPKAEYWDRFAARTKIDTLHFQDVPTLASFDCPDGSHIDAGDRRAFTEALLDAIEARGWLARP